MSLIMPNDRMVGNQAWDVRFEKVCEGFCNSVFVSRRFAGAWVS